MNLDDYRRFYAEEVRLAAQIKSAALVNAFARVPREKYLGPGPWQVAAVAMGKSLGKGIMALIVRNGDTFTFKVITFILIYSCASVRDPQFEPLLGKAMASGAILKSSTIRRDNHEPGESCILHGHNICFTRNEAVTA